MVITMAKEIRIGKKSKGSYVSAVLYAFNHNKEPIVIAGLGGQTSKAFDVAEKVTNTLENVHEVKTETFQKDGLQGVRITLCRGGSGG